MTRQTPADRRASFYLNAMPTDPTYTFDPGLSTTKDWMRSALQDTGQGETYPEGDWILSDQELTAYYGANGWNDGIALAATAMANNYAARNTAYKAGSTDAEFQWKDRVTQYTAMAALARRGGIPDPSSPVRIVDVPASTPYANRRRVNGSLLGGGCDRRPGWWPF